MKTLVVGGDVGGMKALVAPFQDLHSCTEFLFVDHRNIKDYFNDISNKTFISIQEAEQLIENNEISQMYFSTSVSDPVALNAAAKCKEKGIKVRCVLDNWMNYKSRFEFVDEIEGFLPDTYFLMDELGKDEAINEGITEDIIKVTGQPALEILKKQANYSNQEVNSITARIKEELNIPTSNKIISFISEPCILDQGSSLEENSKYRGYTEESILKHLVKEIEKYDNYSLIVLPHPRQPKGQLEKFWKEECNDINGGILYNYDSHDVVRVSDYNTGMCSILLYISWLFSKPTMSIQLNLINNGLRNLEKREEIFFETDEKDFPNKFKTFLKEDVSFSKRKELELHLNAPNVILNEIMDNK